MAEETNRQEVVAEPLKEEQVFTRGRETVAELLELLPEE